MTQPSLLIDADILIYKAIASVERETEWEEGVWTILADVNEAFDSFQGLVKSIVKRSGVDKYILCVSCTKNFRKDLCDTYKGNRKGTRKPIGFLAFKDKIVTELSPVIKPTLEADDVLGILATKPKTNFIIVSDDKDLKQIPGKHLDGSTIVTVTKEQGDLFHYTQTLSGDQVDGYAGCPGIGPKKAEQILLKGHEDPWGAIVETYLKNNLTEKDALLQARLAKILRWEDWDMKKQEVKLWTPTIMTPKTK